VRLGPWRRPDSSRSASRATTSDIDQAGPARLLSISPDAFDRSLTIGQDGPDLVIRLRTPFTGPNGRSPEFIVPNVFTDVEPHRLVLTYDDSILRLTVDDPPTTYELRLMPALAVLMTLFPDDVGQMRVTDWGPAVLRGVYRALMFVPWAAWLAADRRAWAPGAPSAVRAATRSLLLVVPALATEGVLANLIPGYSFEPASSSSERRSRSSDMSAFDRCRESRSTYVDDQPAAQVRACRLTLRVRCRRDRRLTVGVGASNEPTRALRRTPTSPRRRRRSPPAD